MSRFSVAERVWGGVGAGFAVGVLSTALVWAASGPEIVETGGQRSCQSSVEVKALVEAPHCDTETLEVPGPTITRTQTVTSSQTVSETLTATSTVVNTTTAVIGVPTTATEYVDVTQYVNVPVTAPSSVSVTEQSQVSEPAIAVPGNWMEELLPQVDPAGLGVWLFEVHPETGSWGTTDGYTVWIDPDVPKYARYSVMIHEQAHILQRVYYGSLDQAQQRSGDMESLADCMAQQMGATVLSYGCDEQLVPVAKQILGG